MSYRWWMPLTLIVVSLIFSVELLAKKNDKVFYGEDSLISVQDFLDPQIRSMFRSIALVSKASYFDQANQSFYRTYSRPIGPAYGLCSGERFVNSASLGFCTAFLIKPNQIMTAGHCIKEESDCSKLRFIFDYVENPLGQEMIWNEQVFSCKKILKWSKAPPGTEKNLTPDFAIIELNRAATGRKPLEINYSQKVDNNSHLAVVGHPLGMPMMIDPQSKFREIVNQNYFRIISDTFAGNSGSPVINLETYKVEGVFVRGENDFTFDNVLNCFHFKYCRTEACRGEDVTRAIAIPKIR